MDGAAEGRGGAELGHQRRVVDAIETGRDIRIEHVLRLLAERGEEHFERIVCGASWAEAERVRLEARFPFRFQSEPDQGLRGPIPQRRHPHSTLRPYP